MIAGTSAQFPLDYYNFSLSQILHELFKSALQT